MSGPKVHEAWINSEGMQNRVACGTRGLLMATVNPKAVTCRRCKKSGLTVDATTIAFPLDAS